MAVPPVSSGDDAPSSCRGDLDVPLSNLIAESSKPIFAAEEPVAVSLDHGVVPTRTAVVSFEDAKGKVLPTSRVDDTLFLLEKGKTHSFE